MKNKFDKIINDYINSFKIHGDSPSSLLTPKGRNDLRFSSIMPFITKKGLKILDYGCGLGYLYKYLPIKELQIDYTGLDIVPEFIEFCNKNYEGGTFKIINDSEKFENSYDIIFSSGVFNIQTHSNPNESKDYAFKRIEELFLSTNKVMICDFLSKNVDFEQENAQHFSLSELSSFCFSNLSRKFVFRHDILPYELTMIVWKNDKIISPDNVFDIDR